MQRNTDRGGSLSLDRSTDFKVICRFLPAIAHDFILNNLSLVEGAQPRAFDCRNVDEHVPASTLGWMNPKPFAGLNHFTFPVGIVGSLRCV